MKLSRRGFIAGLGALLTPLVGWAKPEETTNIWKKVRERADGARQVIYGNEKAVAMFCYTPDGYCMNARTCTIENWTRENPVQTHEEWLDGYLDAWSSREDKRCRLNTSTRDNQLINGSYEMTEDNVEWYLENFEHSNCYSNGGTAVTPEEYHEWHVKKNSMPWEEFRRWANETHNANI